MQSLWAVARAEILNLLQVRNFVAGGLKICCWGLKLWIVVATWMLSLEDFERDHLLEGRVDLVILGGLCLGTKDLGLSHLDLNLLVEELDWIFLLKGFFPS